MAAGAFSDLDHTFGRENVGKLATAYETVLAAAARSSPGPYVDRETRLAIVTCLIAEARRGEFDPGRLAQAAMTRTGIVPDPGLPAPEPWRLGAGQGLR